MLSVTLPATSFGDVYTKGIKGCKLQDVVDRVSDGRFIWKPTAARFEVHAVLVLSRSKIGYHVGLAVTVLLVATYKSAEEERSIELCPGSFNDFVSALARGIWRANLAKN